MKQSEWMKGLLWAERFIKEGVFFEDDETGVDSLHWELYYSGDGHLIECFNHEWREGAKDYLKNYEERLK